eukprot:c17569_g1_i2.p1 GENE.c17569_g1_i2~~c17569_g1_i2.p1  ORF type:complete len:452 (+),score=87.41 c17569_g1_i2:46-1356(+)
MTKIFLWLPFISNTACFISLTFGFVQLLRFLISFQFMLIEIVATESLALLLCLGSFCKVKDTSLVSCSTWLGLLTMLCLVVVCIFLPPSTFCPSISQLRCDLFHEAATGARVATAFSGLTMVCWCFRGYPLLVRYKGDARKTRNDFYNLVPLIVEVVVLIGGAAALGMMLSPSVNRDHFNVVIAIQVLQVGLVLSSVVAGGLELRFGDGRMCGSMSLSFAAAVVNAVACLLHQMFVGHPVCGGGDAGYDEGLCAAYRALLVNLASLGVSAMAVCIWIFRIFYLSGEVAGRQGRPSYYAKKRFWAPIWIALLGAAPAVGALILLLVQLAIKANNTLYLGLSFGSTILGIISVFWFASVGRVELVTLRANPLCPGWFFAIFTVLAFSLAANLTSRLNGSNAPLPSLLIVSAILSSLGAFAAGDVMGRNQLLLGWSPEN